jgi:hypothetical protein
VMESDDPLDLGLISYIYYFQTNLCI